MPTPLIYRTVTMLAAIQAMPTHRTFLSRYFPTTAPVKQVCPEDIFPGEEVAYEEQKRQQEDRALRNASKGWYHYRARGLQDLQLCATVYRSAESLTIDDLNRKDSASSSSRT